MQLNFNWKFYLHIQYTIYNSRGLKPLIEETIYDMITFRSKIQNLYFIVKNYSEIRILEVKKI